MNYKREMVREHFGDGSRWDARIEYVEEEESNPLGTAGALSLHAAAAPKHPMIVMNGDILTKVAFGSLLDFHHEHGSAGDHVRARLIHASAIRRDRRSTNIASPKSSRSRCIASWSMPAYMCWSLQPIEMVPCGAAYDMPTLFEGMARERRSASVFPMPEYWLDIGRIDDFNKANDDYFREFWTGEARRSDDRRTNPFWR